MAVSINLKLNLDGTKVISATLKNIGQNFKVVEDASKKANTSLSSTTSVIKNIDTSLSKLSTTTGLTSKSIKGIQQNIESSEDSFVGLSSTITVAVGAFIALRRTTAGLDFLTGLGYNISKGFTALSGTMTNLSKKFPQVSKIGVDGFKLLSSVTDKATSSINNLRGFIVDLFGKFKSYFNETIQVGKAFGTAAKQTEVFQKGIIATTTRMTLMSGGLVGLGRVLLDTDSAFGKFAGVTLIAAAAAIGGLAVIINSFLGVIGDLIYSVGTGLTNAMQKSVDQMVKAEEATFAYEFVIKNLNKETQGATGSLEEWNSVIDEFITKTGFSRTETQKSVSEMLRFGDSIGLTKKQMTNLLPIISDVAAANHKDLFQSTLAVVEGLAGQAVMLQNMGINLTQHALKESKVTKSLGEQITTLTEHEKVQLRYNVLLEKATTIAGLAIENGNTYAQLLKRQEAAWKDLNAVMGKGAELIEQKINVGFTALVETLKTFSPELLKATGFIGALSGRILQVTGLFVKWSFAIVLASTSYKALSSLLASQVIQKYIIQLSQATVITKTLAGYNSGLAKTFSTLLLNIGTTGLKFKSLGSLALATFAAINKAALTVLAPFALVALKIGAVVGAVYLLFQGLKRIDQQTQIFTKAWSVLVGWWQKSSVIDDIKGKLVELGDYMGKQLLKGIFATAKGLVYFYKIVQEGILVWNKFSQALDLYILNEVIDTFGRFSVVLNIWALNAKVRFLEIKNAITDFTDRSLEKISEFVSGVATWFAKLPGKMLGVIGIQSAWAGEIAKTTAESEALRKTRDALREGESKVLADLTKQIEKQEAMLTVLDSLKIAKQGLTEEDKKSNEVVQGRIDKANELISSLESQLQTELSGIKKIKDESGDIEVVIHTEVDKEAFAKSLAEAAKDPFKLIFGKLKLDLSQKLGVGTGIANAMTSGAEGAKKLLVGGVSKGIDTLVPGLGSALEPLIGAFTKGPKAVKKMVTGFLEAIPKMAANIIKSAPAFIEAIIDEIPNFIAAVIDGLADAIDFIVESIPSIIMKLINLLPMVIQRLVDAMPNLIESLIKALPNLISALIKAMPSIAISLAKSMPLVGLSLGKSMPGVALSLAKDMPSVAVSFITSIAKGAPAALSKIFSGFGSNIFSKFKELLSKFNPINLFSKLFKLPGGAPGPVEKFIGLNFPVVKFSKGGAVGKQRGLVPGSAPVKGDSELNDRVLSLLSPGEIVLPRTVVQGGLDSITSFLKQMNLKDGMVRPSADGSVQKFGLGSFFSGAVGSLGGAISGGLSFVTGAAESLIQGDPGKFEQELQKLQNAVIHTVDGVLPVPEYLKEIIASLKMLGANINIVKFVKNPLKEAKSAVLSVLDVFKPAFKKIVKPAQLAAGGEIPSGFPNDTFNANLSSGEIVLDKSTATKLTKYLDQQDSNRSNGVSDVLLARVIELLETPITTTANIELDQRSFADILLQLNRTNTRVAI